MDVTAIVDAELRRPRDGAARGAPDPAHSSQDDGEAEAEAEAHGGSMRGGPVSSVFAANTLGCICCQVHSLSVTRHPAAFLFL